ncbi:MAG: hypothetical protein GY862_18610, partial [Gammaproteobacteria bacterium]|nr:hypothetical protein [Gammaproteobacteria bacterium]
EAQRQTLRLATDYRGAIGGLSAFTEQQLQPRQPDNTLYGAQFSTGLIYDKTGWTVSGGEEAESAVLIDIQGKPDNAAFDVLVDHRAVAKARAGKPQLIALPAYKRYEIGIKPREDTFTHYDARSRPAVLYPGSSLRLTWQVAPEFILITQVVDETGNILTNASVENASSPAEIDDSGFLQTEVSSGSVLQVIPENTAKCQIQVPELESGEPLVILEQLVCRQN